MITGSSHDDADKKKWQTKLLPLMSKTIVLLSFFFFIASLIQIIYLQDTISKTAKFDIHESFSNLVLDSSSSHQEVHENTRLKSLVMLEAISIEDQYHQASVLLMSRLWISYIGFLTGMILAIVGATFILGKLQETVSELSTKLHGADLTFKSASPGLILTVLGTALMLTTIVTHHNIEVKHRALYFHDSQVKSYDDQEEPPILPPPLPRPNKNDSSNNNK